jgi:hypothetical protein
VVTLVVVCLSPVGGQQLLDRVVARVDGYAITLTDVNAALALGLVDAPEDGDRFDAATERLIDRQLVLAEVVRFAPPEPDPAEVDRQVEAMRAEAGARLDEMMRSTGMDEARIRAAARDSLRIESYLNQRFGITVQVSGDEVVEYYRTHQDEFAIGGGAVMPYADAEPIARERAAALRRTATIGQWLRDLRGRADISRPRP